MKFLKIGLTVVLVSFLSACQQISFIDPNNPEEHLKQIEESQEEMGSEIRDYLGVSYSQSMTTLNPNRAMSEQDFHNLQLIGEGLYRKQADGSIKKGVLDSVKKDQQTYLFKISDQAVWADQKAVRAEDFVLSWQQLVDPSQQNFFGHILNGKIKNAREIQNGELPASELAVEAVDDKVLKVTLADDLSLDQIEELFSLPSLFPLPSHHIEEIESYGEKSSDVLSNGPYSISNWQEGWEVWHLKKNYEYWNEEAYPTAHLVGYSFNQNDLAMANLKNQLVDIADHEASNEGEISKSYYLLANQYSQVLDLETPLADDRLRQAIFSAIQPALISQALPVENQAVESAGQSFSREELNQILQTYLEEQDMQAMELEIVIDLHENSKRIAESIQEQLHQQFDGLSINIRPLQAHDLKERLLDQNFSLAILSRSTENDSIQSQFLSAFQSESPSNFLAYNNPAFDQIIQSPSAEKQQAKELLIEDHVILPLLTIHRTYAFGPAVENPENFSSSIFYDFQGLIFQSGEWTRPTTEEED